MIRCSNCGWSNNENANSNCEKCNAPLIKDDLVGQPAYQQEDFSPSKTVRESIVDGAGVPPQHPNNPNRLSPSSCPSCGYPLRDGVIECPQCHCNTAVNTPIPIPVNEKSCPKCGKINSPQSKFCNSCGYSLSESKSGSNHCPKCGEENQVDALFCDKCGSSLKQSRDINKTVLPSQMSRCSLSLIADTNENIEPIVLQFSDNENILNRENTEPNNKTISREEQACLSYENKKWFIVNKSSLNSTFVFAKEKVELKSGDIIMLGDRKFEFRN